MEDNELGLEYGINFNVKDGGKKATEEIEQLNKNWTDYLKAHPLKVNFETFQKASNRTGAEKIIKDTKQEATGLKSEISALEKQWSQLNATQRKSSDGQALLARYRNTVNAAGEYSSTLRSAVKSQDAMSKKEEELVAKKTRSTEATDRATEAYRRQGNIISNLKGIASTYVSIYAADRLVRNIAEVTGMFELQEKSLQAIIRDKAAAEEIFSQTKALAIKSPFQFKELVSYVKQLSAYRVETDQLYDTMKNLADVSAGLGVDMNRIILAYGQVKSASVLRGQELRQFTEAGIPLVQELADKFSELEKRTVSTNEVFGLISQRKVSFEMIRDIFGDMTKEGGIFYKMQEVQSETLAGKISNLKDAFDIMFNAIGSDKTINGFLKGTVDTIMLMARNWQTVGGAVAPVIAGLGLYRVSMAAIVAVENSRIKTSSALSRLYNAELVSISRRSAANQRSIAEDRAVILQQQVKNALIKENIYSANAQTISEQAKNDMITAGLSASAIATAQEKLKNTLIKEGISATVAATIAQKSYQSAVLGASTATKGLWITTKAMLLSNPIGWIITIASTIFSAISIFNGFTSASKKLRKALEEIDATVTSEMNSSIGRFEHLARTVGDGTKTVNEQADALKTLKSKYSEMMPEYILTEEWLKNNKEGYDEATIAIREYYAAKSKEKMFSEIDNNYAENTAKPINKLKQQFELMGLDAETAAGFVDEFQKRLMDINPANLEGALKIFKSMYDETTGGNIDIVKWQQEWLTATNQIRKIYDKTKDYNNLVKNVMTDGGIYVGKYAQSYKDLQKNIEDTISIIEDNRVKDELKFSGYEFDRQKADKEQGLIINYLRNIVKVSKDELDKAIRNQDFSTLQKSLSDSFAKSLAGRVQELYADPVTSSINNLYANSGLPTDIINKLQKKDIQETGQYTSEVNDYYDQSIKKLKELGRANKDYVSDRLVFDYVLGKNRVATRKEDELYYAQLKKGAKIYRDNQGISDDVSNTTTSGSTTDPLIEKYKNQIEIMEQAGETYKDLVASGYTKANALAKTKSLFGDKLGSMAIPTTAKEYIDNYNEAIRLLSSRKGTKDDVFGVTLKIFVVEKEDAQKKMKDYIDAMQSEFDNSKKRISFFDDLFNVTGDYGLSSKIAKDLYGDGGVKIQAALKDAIKKALKDTNISETDIFSSDGNIDLNKAYELANKLDAGARKDALLEILNATRDFQQKEYVEMLKGAEKHQEYEDKITQIMLEGMAKRNKIANDIRFTPEQKGKLIRSSKNEDASAIAKIELEKFKNSDTWVKAFSDVEKLSNESIASIASKIRDFREKYADQLSATDLKELTNKIEEFEKRTEDVDLSALFHDMFTKVDIEPLKKKVDEARAEVERLMASRDEAAQNENDAKNEADSYDGQPDSPEKRAAEANLTAARLKTVEVTNLLTGANKNLADSEKDVTDASNKQQSATVKFLGKLDKISDGVSSIKSAFDSLTGTYKETAEAMGIAIGEEQLAFIDGISSGLGAVVGILGAITVGITAVNAAAKLLKMSNPELLAIAAALAVIVSTISIINKLSLAKYNRSIEEHENKIEKLEKSYDKLKSISNNLLGSEYISNTNEQIKLLKEKIKETEELYRVEKKRLGRMRFWSEGSSVDKQIEIGKKMDGYIEDIAKMENEIADIQLELAGKLAGIDITSAAEDFADEWLDAYLSFENTADAIEAKFKEMMRNMVLNSILSSIMNETLKPVYEMIENLSKDGKLDTGDLKQIFGLFDTVSEAGDNLMTAVMEGLGTWTDEMRDSTSNLSGLSKGIAGASEETVGILAGYMDSIRFKLFAYIDYMMASGQGNTMSSLMQAQTTQIVHLANIDANTLRSAIANEDLTKEVKKLISVGSKGTYALNVNI